VLLNPRSDLYAVRGSAVKERVNAITLAPLEDFRRDSDLFGASVQAPGTQRLIARAMELGLQTHAAELDLVEMLVK
jgi:hypothetical protein